VELRLIMEAAIIVMLIVNFIFIIVLLIKSRHGSQERVLQKLTEYDTRLDKNESSLRNELEVKFGQNRMDLTTSLKSVSDQLSNTITNFTGLVDSRMKTIYGFLESGLNVNRKELSASLQAFEEKSSARIETLTKGTQEGLERTREAVEKKLADIQQGNEKKLDEMRHTVDEKLHKTLETRLGESFKWVSDRLELVQQGLGEMKSLASDVGDLKKVMSNVKSKGVLGEYQLEAILEQILSPGQYGKNIKTKAGSNDHVEFAIKIPSKEDTDRIVWLPIDAKLPTSDYETLVDAYESGEKDTVENARKAFSRTVIGFAKKINEKYIDPPNTTDFAIMFLPFEGAYAEVVRDPSLYEGIQREYKIIVTGPSTIAAFLNALQIGFRSLVVGKRTSDILSTLSTVRKEFGTFGDILNSVKNQIDSASKTLDEKVGRRTRVINKAFKELDKFDALPDDTLGQKVLSDAESDLDEASS